MHRFDKAGFNRRDQRRMRIQRPVLADLAAQAERFAIGRQDQFDGGGVETDAMVEALDFVFGVDALDGHHRHEHLDLRDLRRVAGEERLDVMRRRRLGHEADPVGRDVDARQHVDDFIDLGDDDAAAEGGRLDDRRRVFGIGTGVEIAVAIRRLCRHQGNPRRQVDEIAAEQFQVGMDCADVELAGGRQLGQPAGLGTGEGKVQFRGDAFFEDVQMLRQGQHREQHVQVMHTRRIEPGQRLRQEVGLLLVIAFEADAIARFDDGVQQIGNARRRQELAFERVAEHAACARQAFIAIGLPTIPDAVGGRHLLHSHDDVGQAGGNAREKAQQDHGQEHQRQERDRALDHFRQRDVGRDVLDHK